MFGLFFIMMLFKGIFLSAAGPAPNYDMQRVLSTRTPSEAAKMSSLVSVVLNPSRYFMVAGLAILALVNFDTLYTASLTKPDFESILPQVLATYVPVGLLGFPHGRASGRFHEQFCCNSQCRTGLHCQ